MMTQNANHPHEDIKPELPGQRPKTRAARMIKAPLKQTQRETPGYRMQITNDIINIE